MDTIEEKIAKLKQAYEDKPDMREIIRCQIRALELASGKAFLNSIKPQQMTLEPQEDTKTYNAAGEALPWE